VRGARHLLVFQLEGDQKKRTRESAVMPGLTLTDTGETKLDKCKVTGGDAGSQFLLLLRMKAVRSSMTFFQTATLRTRLHKFNRLTTKDANPCSPGKVLDLSRHDWSQDANAR